MNIYQGLFYLTFAISFYFLMLLILRLISSKRDNEVMENDSSCVWHSKEVMERDFQHFLQDNF